MCESLFERSIHPLVRANQMLGRTTKSIVVVIHMDNIIISNVTGYNMSFRDKMNNNAIATVFSDINTYLFLFFYSQSIFFDKILPIYTLKICSNIITHISHKLCLFTTVYILKKQNGG